MLGLVLDTLGRSLVDLSRDTALSIQLLQCFYQRLISYCVHGDYIAKIGLLFCYQMPKINEHISSVRILQTPGVAMCLNQKTPDM